MKNLASPESIGLGWTQIFVQACGVTVIAPIPRVGLFAVVVNVLARGHGGTYSCVDLLWRSSFWAVSALAPNVSKR